MYNKAFTITVSIAILLFVFTKIDFFQTQQDTETTITEREKYEAFINAHEYSNKRYTKKELKQIPKKDRPDLAWEQNFLETMNPALGRPEVEKLYPVFQMTKAMQKAVHLTLPGAATAPWVERGPNNVGGRTRALVWDPTSANKAWAGGVTGGLWYNNDVTNSTSIWQSVNDFWDNIAISAIAFDPNNSSIIYVGTGEGWNSQSSRGAGIWKSVDGGASFTRLSSTASFYYINDLVVRNEAGTSVVYAAVAAGFYQGQWFSTDEGLQRSTNGGTSWSQVLPNVGGFPEKPTDLDIAADNELWVGVDASSFGTGGGKVYTSSTGTSFNLKHSHSSAGRVNIACAPSNSNYVYAAFVSGLEMDAFKQTTNDGTSWTTLSEPVDADPGIPATDFTRGQAWYDLTLDVDPNNENTVIMGGIDLFKTTDGGVSWLQLTHWYGGFGFQEIHADQHAVVYKPGSSNSILFGNDGGVAYTGNGSATTPTIVPRVNGYNVTQFYACAINPDIGSHNFLAGSQDNGTQRFTSAGVNSTLEVAGGDGALCHIDQTNSTYQTASSQYNHVYHSSDGGGFFNIVINDGATGRFINPSDLDDNQNILYTYIDQTSLYKLTGIESGSPVVSTIAISDIQSAATYLAVSPYTTTSTTLYIGTLSGRLFKMTNADSSPSSTEITGGAFPNGAISSITFGQTENEMIVTFSNYGVTSVWYTTNGGASWVSKEGDLPDMPIRSALFNPTNSNEVIVATEVGVWGTTNFSSSFPNWNATNSGLANVRVDMLKMRTSDNEVVAATYGRGLFSSSGFGGPALCTASSMSSSNEHITNVTLNSINNNSGSSGYHDYTAQSTVLARGNAYNCSVTYTGNNTTNEVRVWIDFNQNDNFSDPGEEFIFPQGAGTGSPYNLSIPIPANALLGETKMRIRLHDTANQPQTHPCGNSGTGEVEDYTIEIQNYCSAYSMDSLAEHLTNVSLNTINNTSGSSGYADYSGQVTDLVKGNTYSLGVTYTGSNTTNEVKVWIDFNQNNDFTDVGEEFVFPSGAGTGSPYNLSIPVPSSAMLGPTRMRVRLHDTANQPQSLPCGASGTGEVEDYTVNIQNHCSAASSDSTFEYISNVTFNDLNNSSLNSGYSDFSQHTTTVLKQNTYIFYASYTQAFDSNEVKVWIDFNQNDDFSDPGEEFVLPTGPGTSGPYSVAIPIPGSALEGETTMRVRLHDKQFSPQHGPCGNSGSGEVEDYTINILNYCLAQTTDTTFEHITNVTFNDINNNSGSSGYHDYSHLSTLVGIDSSYVFSVSYTESFNSDEIRIWIDYNQNHEFNDPGEGYAFPTGPGTGGPYSGTITIPTTASIGEARMRVRLVDTGTDTNLPCGDATYGEVEDYTLNIQRLGYCQASADSTYEHISNVTFNDINNTTGSSGYADYTAQSTLIFRDSTYVCSVTYDQIYTGNEVRVWIDFNQNNDFSDAGEEFVFPQGPGSGSPYTLPIQIPSDAQTGPTRMRVRLHDTTFGPQSSSCGDSNSGEVEDYTVNIQTGTNGIGWSHQPADTLVDCDHLLLPSQTGQPIAFTLCSSNGLNISHADVTSAGSCAQGMIVTRTWTAVDSCGNTESFDQVITLNDTVAPTISCLGPQSLVASNGINASLPDYSTNASFSDNCSANGNIAITQVPAIGSIQNAGIINVTLTATDECGNFSSCNFNVDITIPGLITWTNQPTSVVIDCSASSQPSNTGQAAATTACGGGGLNVSYSDAVAGASCPQVAVVTRTWTATDNCGTVETFDQIISINDLAGPTITCPGPQNQIAADSVSTTLNDYTSLASFNDDCFSAGNITVTQLPAAGSIQNVGTVVVALTAEDPCGNSSSCSFNVEVKAPGPIVWDYQPVDTTINCDASNAPSSTGEALATAACPGGGLVVNHTDVVSGGGCTQESLITRTWTAIDNCGNMKTFDQLITVQDTTKPVVLCPVAQSLTATNGVDAALLDYTSMTSITDNCSGLSDMVVTQNPSTGSIHNVGIVNVTITATDQCGNTDSCNFNVDISLPDSISWTNEPIDVSIDCDASILPTNTGEATAITTCTGGVSVTYTDVVASGSCAQGSLITRTWTATDNCGNTETFDQQITVQDTTAPVVTCPASQSLVATNGVDVALPDYVAMASITDNCSALGDMNVVQIPAAGTTENVGIANVTITATDECGNTSSCNFNVDISLPDSISWMNEPSDTTISCEESTLPSNTGEATATTSCVGGGLSHTYTDSTIAGACAQSSIIIRKWVAADNCGNTKTIEQQITVNDNLRPSLTCPSKIEETSIGPKDTVLADYTELAVLSDNCSPDSAVTVTQTPQPGTLISTDTVVVTLIATDECGNASSCSFNAFVQGTTLVPENSLAKIKVFPNPSTGLFQITGIPINEDISVRVYNLLGDIVYDLKNSIGMDSHFIQLENKEAGIYYITIQGRDHSIIKKIMIM